MGFKKHIAARVKAEGLTEQDVYDMLAVPPVSSMGNFALPCFRLAKTQRKAPNLIAQEIAGSYQDSIVQAEALGGYVNFKIDPVCMAKDTLQRILADKDAQQKLLSTPQARELMKQLFGK